MLISHLLIRSILGTILKSLLNLSNGRISIILSRMEHQITYHVHGLFKINPMLDITSLGIDQPKILIKRERINHLRLENFFI